MHGGTDGRGEGPSRVTKLDPPQIEIPTSARTNAASQPAEPVCILRFSALHTPSRRHLASGARRATGADSTCVRRGSSQRCSQLQDRLPGPPTHDLKAGLHHLSHREAYGATWSSLGSSLAKSTFGRPARGALRSGRGTVFTRLWSCEKRVHLHLLKKLECPCGSASPGEQFYRGSIEFR